MKTRKRNIILLLSILLLLAAAASWILFSNSQPPRQTTSPSPSIDDGVSAANGPNILFVVLDALRPDRLSCYGYSKPTSPNIDALAKDGIVFTNYFTQGSWTGPTTASLFTGLLPGKHGVLISTQHFLKGRYFTSVLLPKFKTLAEYMRELNYRTGGFVGTKVIGKEGGYNRGFDNYIDLPPDGYGSLVEKFLSWLEEKPDDKFFAYIHSNGCHAPYSLADEAFVEEYRFPYDGKVGQVNPGLIRNANRGKFQVRKEDLQMVDLLYSGMVRYSDREVIGRLVGALKEKGLYDQTVIVVTADHGEGLWEHGYFGHGMALYNDVIHAPFILKPASPAAGQKGKRDNYFSTVDVMATLLDLAGTEVPSGLDGRSILPCLLNNACESYPVISEELMSVAYINGGHKLIKSSLAHHDFPFKVNKKVGFLKTAAEKEFQLFDLQSDFNETRDLSNARKDLVTKLDRELSSHHGNAAGATRPAMKDMILDDSTIERLRSLGYIE